MTKFQNNLTRTAALLLCSVSLALPAMAQSGQTNDGPPPPPPSGQGPGGMRGGPAARLEMMQRELSLTADQSTKVKAILDDGRAQMVAAREAGDGREKLMAIRKAESDKIRAILDDTQKTKFDEMEKRMRERMRRGQGGEGPPPAPPQQ